MFLGNDSQGQYITFVNSSEDLRGKASTGAGHTEVWVGGGRAVELGETT